MMEAKIDQVSNGGEHLAKRIELMKTAKLIATPGKGILAADESDGTIGKRFDQINVANTERNRCNYRSMLFNSPGLNKYISGVILFEETLFQKTANGSDVVEPLRKGGVVLGIKVDKGAKPRPGFPGDTFTQGLTDLAQRCRTYYEAGCRFAKFCVFACIFSAMRAVLKIQNGCISEQSIKENAFTLARYAATCQAEGLVPIVEPEILMDGPHDLNTCQYWTEKVVSKCFKELLDQKVLFEGMLLKPNMVVFGSDYVGEKSFEKQALATVTALRRALPCAVPGVTFLSGGQSEEEASLNLNAINKLGPHPWSLSFSFGRALQKSCLSAWLGKDENIKAAQTAFITRAEANGKAQLGKYEGGAAGSKDSLFQKGYVY